jgi:TPR repeat protein
MQYRQHVGRAAPFREISMADAQLSRPEPRPNAWYARLLTRTTVVTLLVGAAAFAVRGGHQALRTARQEAQSALDACGAGDHVSCSAVVPLLEAACGRQDGRSCATLAFLAERGIWIDADPRRAASLRRQACQAGETSACGSRGSADRLMQQGLQRHQPVRPAR